MSQVDTTQKMPTDPIERDRWLDTIVPIAVGAELRGGVHVDTLKREDKRRRNAGKSGILVRMSARLLGMRRRTALMLDD